MKKDYTGQIVNGWHIDCLERRDKIAIYRATCPECGKTCVTNISNIKRRSCRHNTGVILRKNYIGETLLEWHVDSLAFQKNHISWYNATCTECGKKTTRPIYYLKNEHCNHRKQGEPTKKYTGSTINGWYINSFAYMKDYASMYNAICIKCGCTKTSNISNFNRNICHHKVNGEVESLENLLLNKRAYIAKATQEEKDILSNLKNMIIDRRDNVSNELIGAIKPTSPFKDITVSFQRYSDDDDSRIRKVVEAAIKDVNDNVFIYNIWPEINLIGMIHLNTVISMSVDRYSFKLSIPSMDWAYENEWKFSLSVLDFTETSDGNTPGYRKICESYYFTDALSAMKKVIDNE